MDFVDRLSGMLGNRWQNVSPNTFMKLTNLHPLVQRHIQRVYVTLACALAVSALGCYADILLHIGGLLTTLAAFGSMVGLLLTPSVPQTLNKRYALLGAFSFCQGASLGPLINAALVIQPGAVFTAVLATCAIFGCFSAAALMTNRRSYMFLGGWLSSAISAFMIMRFGSWIFGGQQLAFAAELYLGLIIFAGYVLFDTQVIVEKAHAGNMDHVKHALDLLVDVFAIFVRVLVILLRNAEKAKERERRKRRD